MGGINKAKRKIQLKYINKLESMWINIRRQALQKQQTKERENREINNIKTNMKQNRKKSLRLLNIPNLVHWGRKNEKMNS